MNKEEMLAATTLMKLEGYFKNNLEYDKTIKFIDEGVVPSWLKNDIEKYHKIIMES